MTLAGEGADLNLCGTIPARLMIAAAERTIGKLLPVLASDVLLPLLLLLVVLLLPTSLS